jgi:hypothetical protein
VIICEVLTPSFSWSPGSSGGSAMIRVLACALCCVSLLLELLLNKAHAHDTFSKKTMQAKKNGGAKA